MICKVCECDLDACCSNYICCTCAKKDFNQKQRKNAINNRGINTDLDNKKRDNVTRQGLYKPNSSKSSICNRCNNRNDIPLKCDCGCDDGCGDGCDDGCDDEIDVSIDTCNDQSIIYRQSMPLSSTTGQVLMTKITLPIVPQNRCDTSKYLIEWHAELGTTDTNPGQARIVLNLTNLPENLSNSPMVLIDTRVDVKKDCWVPYSGASKIVLDSSAIVELNYASFADPNTKNICIRNASINAIKID